VQHVRRKVMLVKTKRGRKSAEITVETDEVVFLGGVRRPTRVVCPVCRDQVSMISPEHAAQIAGVSTRTIYRWVEAGGVHFVETNGGIAICLGSVPPQGVGAKAYADAGSSQRTRI